MDTRLTDYKVLTFDCYGTLIDWESGIWDALQPLLIANDCDAIMRNQGLEAFGKIENAQESETPDMFYPVVLARVHASFAARFNLRVTDELTAAFSALVPPSTSPLTIFLKASAAASLSLVDLYFGRLYGPCWSPAHFNAFAFRSFVPISGRVRISFQAPGMSLATPTLTSQLARRTFAG